MTHTGSIISILLLVSLTGATDTEIIGGRVAKPHSRPYMASLQNDGEHCCGGILIRRDFVLTVAHCKNCYDDITVVLGAQDITMKEKSQQTIKVKKYYPHPNYKGFHNDIMLLKLEKKAKVNKYVKLIELPKEAEKLIVNVSCDVAGWGVTKPKGSVSNVLKEATEKIQFISECNTVWKEKFTSQYMICTKFNKKEGGICQGDSGGPLICNNKLKGIAAYTSGDCDNPKFPHVFTRVDFFLPWIKQVLKKGTW